MDAGVPCSGQHSRGDQLLFHLLHLLPVLAWFPSHFTADVAHLEASKWGSSDVLVTCFYVKDKRRKEKQDIVGDNNGFLSSSPWMCGMMETGFSDSRRCNLSHRNLEEKFKREQLSIVVSSFPQMFQTLYAHQNSRSRPVTIWPHGFKWRWENNANIPISKSTKKRFATTASPKRALINTTVYYIATIACPVRSLT